MVMGTFNIIKDIPNSLVVLGTGLPIPCDGSYVWANIFRDGTYAVRRLAVNGKGELCAVNQGIPAGPYTFATLMYFVKKQVNTIE